MKLLFIFLTTVLLNTGCLTGALSGKIRQQEEVGREWRDVSLRGKSTGVISYQKVNYERYEFCGFKDDLTRILEVLIPIHTGDVVLREHRNYLLGDDLPLTMESGFGVERIFKGTYYERVNFEGDLVELEEPEEDPVEIDFLPKLYQLEPKPEQVQLRELNETLRNNLKKKSFYRPKDSGNKWYLMTTRVEHELALSKRAGTKYFLSTPLREYVVNPEEIDYDQRSWVGNKLLKSSYLVTVPVDVLISPVIFLGALGFAAVVNIIK